MVDAASLLGLFKRWVADLPHPRAFYDPNHHTDAPMAQFFADHGYDEALWLEKARVCMLTACQKYNLPPALYAAIHAEPHTYAALNERLKEI